MNYEDIKNIDQLFDLYVELNKNIIAKKTLGTNISYYSNHIALLFSHRSIDEINPIEYQIFANNLLEKINPRTGKNYKPKTVKNILYVISEIYNTATYIKSYEGENPIKQVKLPKFDNKTYLNMSCEDMKAYINAINNFDEPIFKDIFQLLLHGERLGVALNLKFEQFNISRGVIFVPSETNKQSRDREFKITSKLFDSLRHIHIYAKIMQSTSIPTGYMFINPNTNRPFTDIRRPWKRLLGGADLPYINLHKIRNVVATYAINCKKMHMETVSKALGHSSIEITQQYYIDENINSSLEVLESILGEED
ncbi:MAG: tyrosine-type recombinase/integrase [Campylobacterota bacterium]|nr:tyrosine-type recombinase/integrase [Campylobacterota bacterium]